MREFHGLGILTVEALESDFDDCPSCRGLWPKFPERLAGDLRHIAIQRLLADDEQLLRRHSVLEHKPLDGIKSSRHALRGIDDANTPLHIRRFGAEHLGHHKKFRGLFDFALRHGLIKF